jgi:integrase
VSAAADGNAEKARGDGGGEKKAGKQPGARGNREGKPWKRGDGRWAMRLYPPEGSVRERPRYIYGKTRKECKDNYDKAKAGQDAGIAPEPGEKELRIGPAMRKWLYGTLPQYVRAGAMSETTMASYQDAAENHIIPGPGKPGPSLAHIGLLALLPGAVRDWQDGLLRKRSSRQRRKLRPGEAGLPPAAILKPRTAEYARAILHRFLEDMIRDQSAGLKQNVVDLVPPPLPRGKKAQAKRMRPVIRPEQAGALLVEMARDRLWCYWLVAFAQGFRRGEGLGMRWEDIDFDARTWTPVQQVNRVAGPRDPVTGRRKGRLVARELKTAASGEKTALTRNAARALARWEAEQNRMRRDSPRWAELGLVFTTRFGTALEPRNVNRSWEALCARAGVPGIRLHDLRHACASYALAKGADSKSVQRMLRHARLETTELYLHAVEDVPRTAADAIDAAIDELTALGGEP